MRLFDIVPLNESRGFPGRRPGDEYVDPTNREDVATFQGLVYLPEEGPAFDTNQNLMAAVDEYTANADGTVYQINSPSRSVRAAMIVNMDTPRGPEHYILFTKDNKTPEGKLTNIPPNIIPNHGGYVMNRQISHSERAGLKPAEILTSMSPLSPESVPALLERARETAGDAAVDQMQQYLEALIAGQGTGFVIENGAENIMLHQKYLGEWAAPIALITGQFTPESMMSKLEENMTGCTSLSEGKIVYNTNSAEALFDSMVTVGTHEIMISSKAKKGNGAAASLKGLYDTMINKSDSFPERFWEEPKAKKFKAIATNIMSKTTVEGMLSVARLEGVIDGGDEAILRKGMADERQPFVPNDKLTDYMSDYAAYTYHPQYSAVKHALTAVARKLCKKLNEEDYTDVMREILNHANVIQMYFDATAKNKDLVCKGFTVVWPPNFVGKIKFYSDKMYSATRIGGRIGFKIGNNAVDDEPDESLKVKIDDRALAKIEKAEKTAADRAVGKITQRGELDTRDTTISDKVALGRAKKK